MCKRARHACMLRTRGAAVSAQLAWRPGASIIARTAAPRTAAVHVALYVDLPMQDDLDGGGRWLLTPPHAMTRHARRPSAPGVACLRLVTHNVRKQLATRHAQPFCRTERMSCGVMSLLCKKLLAGARACAVLCTTQVVCSRGTCPAVHSVMPPGVRVWHCRCRCGIIAGALLLAARPDMRWFHDLEWPWWRHVCQSRGWQPPLSWAGHALFVAAL